jgi:hypothetical protein
MTSQVGATDVYTYIGEIVEAINEGFPRSAWLLIGDHANRSMRSRLDLTFSTIAATAAQGFVIMVTFLIYPQSLASIFVSAEARQSSLTDVRLSFVLFFTSAVEVAISSSACALDNPDVQLIVSSSKFIIKLVLDLLVISRFRVNRLKLTVIHHGIIQLVFDRLPAFAVLASFVYVVARRTRDVNGRRHCSI